MINSGNFLSYIGDNYNQIKKRLMFWCYKNKQKFSEDVFHNTIIQCNETTLNNNLTFKDENIAFAYIFQSFKTNLIREKLYANNKPKEEVKEYDKIDNRNSIEEECDMNIIKESVVNNFGEKSYDILIEHINGENTNDLQEKHNIKNMKGKIKKIKNFISDNFFKE